LSKAELEFKEIELLGTDDTETLQTKLSSLTERIRGYQSDISALNEQIAKLQSDSLAISSEGMKPDTYSQYLSLQNDLEAVMRKWTDAKTQKETAQSMLSAYNTLGEYEQQLAQDELSLSYAENELEKSKAGTSAPVDGIITECLVDAGAYVDKGTPVAEMQSDDSYKVRMMISKYDIPSVKLGQDADINVGNKQYSGKVSKIDQTAETDISGKAKASIEILIDSDEAFIIGLDADVTIHLESAEDVLAVPTSCLYTDDEGSYVYIYENGTVEKAYVDVGKKDSKFAQVEGIGEGAHIVSEPSADNYVDQKVKEKIKKK
ncbi:MAG: efflux RND transporter periplasmic adaptor subunit, partial [Paenibacillus sp.]|nr:efflux RND transporter periplasmic adaptor subunit [Paenibacillus sp.]